MVKKIVQDFLYGKDSYQIRGACFDVWKIFKGIFKEKIIENALRKELENRGLKAEAQKRIKIYYKGEQVGVYTPDLILNNRILIEIKVKPYLTKDDEKQFWLYLQGSQYKLGFLINFGTKKLEIKRRVYDKARQKYLSVSSQRSDQRFKSASINKAFTLLEITVVIAITSILATIFVASYRGSEKQFALQRSAHKLSQDLRVTQEMAMAGERFYGAFPKGGHGIYFTEDSNSYILFADCNNDKVYSLALLTCPDCTGASCIENVFPEKIKDFFLEEGIKISAITPVSPLSIVFFPPDPTITISGGNEGIITLSPEVDPTKIKTVRVNSVGLIDVD